MTAASVLERAILRYPDHADAHLNLGQVYYSIHRRDDAYREFESALSFSREFSTLISAHLGLMAICHERGDHEEAARQYELAKKIYPQLDRILIQDEIHRLTPAPVYVGDPFRGDGIHPSWEHRIQKLERQLGRPPGGMK